LWVVCGGCGVGGVWGGWGGVGGGVVVGGGGVGGGGGGWGEDDEVDGGEVDGAALLVPGDVTLLTSAAMSLPLLSLTDLTRGGYLPVCVCVVCGDTSLIQSRRCTITTQAVHK